MDITMCKGVACPLKETCKRYTASPSELQSWFSDEPYRYIEGKIHCDLYWGLNQTALFEQFNEITNGETEADKQTDGGENGIGKETKND